MEKDGLFHRREITLQDLCNPIARIFQLTRKNIQKMRSFLKRLALSVKPNGTIHLVSAKDKKVKDFIGIELQTMDTTGTVWPERQKFLNENGIAVDPVDLNNKSFGMNWKMTLKTILIQMHHKSETFEHLNKHLVLIIQKPLYEHMKSDFSFDGIEGVRLGDPVHIHSYNFVEENHHLNLSLGTRVSTDSGGIANCLGLNAESKVELQDLIHILEPKLIEANRLKIGISG